MFVFYVVMAFSRSLRKDFKRSITVLIKLLNFSISGSSNFIDGLGLAKAKGSPSPDFN